MEKYCAMEKAINSPNTDNLDEDTKNFVIGARLEKDHILANKKREILQSYPEEQHVSMQQFLANISGSDIKPHEEYKNQSLLQPSCQNIHHFQNESSNLVNISIPLKSADENAKQSSSDKEQQIDSKNQPKLQSSLAMRQTTEVENLSKPFGKKVQQCFLGKRQKIESERALKLKPLNKHEEPSFSPQKQKIESEIPLTELSFNWESPPMMVPKSESTPASVLGAFDSALGDEIEDSANELFILHTSLPVNRTLFDSACENSTAAGDTILKSEGQKDFSDLGVAENDVAGQDSIKHVQ